MVYRWGQIAKGLVKLERASWKHVYSHTIP